MRKTSLDFKKRYKQQKEVQNDSLYVKFHLNPGINGNISRIRHQNTPSTKSRTNSAPQWNSSTSVKSKSFGIIDVTLPKQRFYENAIFRMKSREIQLLFDEELALAVQNAKYGLSKRHSSGGVKEKKLQKQLRYYRKIIKEREEDLEFLQLQMIEIQRDFEDRFNNKEDDLKSEIFSHEQMRKELDYLRAIIDQRTEELLVMEKEWFELDVEKQRYNEEKKWLDEERNRIDNERQQIEIELLFFIF